MINIGIITDDSPETDPSLKLFNQISKHEGSAVFVINPFLTINQEIIKKLDIVIPRISGHNEEKIKYQIDFFIDLVKKNNLIHLGNLKLLPFQKDKAFQNTWAQRAGLLVPETQILSKNDAFQSLKDKFGLPFIIKACYSYGGDDVFLINNEKEYKDSIKTARKYIVQKFIKTDKIIDYRVYIVGNKVICGLERENYTEGEFRSNTKQGAIGSYIRPTRELSKLAKKYTDSLKIDLLAVDFIKQDNDYYFIEANDAFSVNIKNEFKKIIVAESILQYCKFKVSTQKGKKWIFRSLFPPRLLGRGKDISRLLSKRLHEK